MADKMWDILRFLKPSPEEELRDAANNQKKMEMDSQLVEAIRAVEGEIDRAEALEEQEPGQPAELIEREETPAVPDEVIETPVAEPEPESAPQEQPRPEPITEELSVAQEEPSPISETEMLLGPLEEKESAPPPAAPKRGKREKKEKQEKPEKPEPKEPTEQLTEQPTEQEKPEQEKPIEAVGATGKEKEIPADIERSLESLMRQEPAPVEDVAPESGRQLLDIPVDEIVPNPYQPRLLMVEEDISELAQSIREVGILQPVLVRRAASGYELIAGERRLRAAKEIGLATIPALVTDVDPMDQQLMALVENLQRKNLSAVEEGKCLQDILARTKWNQTDLAKRLGRSQAAVANKIRLLKLDPTVQQWVMEGKLGERQARTLLGFTADEQIELGNRAIRDELSVKELDALALVLQDRNPPTRKKAPKEKSVSHQEPEDREILQDIASLVNKHRAKGLEAQWKVREFAGETLVIEITVDMKGNLVAEGEGDVAGA